MVRRRGEPLPPGFGTLWSCVALDLQRFLEQAQRPVILAVIVIRIAKVDQRIADALAVAQLALDIERLLVILQGKWQSPQAVLELSDGMEALRHSALLADATLDFERLLVIAQRVLGLAHDSVSDANGLQDRGFLFLVIELDGQTERAVKVIEAARRVVLLDFHPSLGQEGIDTLRIAVQYLGVEVAGPVERPGLFVEARKSGLDVGIAGRHFGQIFVRLDRFSVILHDPCVAGCNPILFLGWKLLAELDRPTRVPLRLAVFPQVGVSLGQLRIGQSKRRIFFRGSLESLLSLEIITLPQELEPVIVVTKSRERIRGGLESLRLEFLHHRGGQGEVFPDRLRQSIDRAGNRIRVRRFRLHRRGVVPFQVLDRGIDANPISEPGVLPPNHGLCAAKFRHPPDCGGIEGRVGR